MSRCSVATMLGFLIINSYERKAQCSQELLLFSLYCLHADLVFVTTVSSGQADYLESHS